MVYSIISLVCIAIMFTLVAYVIVKFFRCDRAEKIEFIKDFKKGKCAIIYIVAIPLITIANIYADKPVYGAIFDAISKSVQLVVLKYDVSYALIKDNLCFAIAIYLCFTLVILNAAMFTVSILHQSLWKKSRLNKFARAKSDKCIIVGNNADSAAVYKSCGVPALLVDVMSKDEQTKLFIKGTSYQSLPRGGQLFDWLQKLLKKQTARLHGLQKKINVIVNLENEQNSLQWCERFLKLIRTMDDDVADKMEIYVFGGREFEDLYSKYEKNSKGCLHYVNEFQQVAIDFIDRFPLTEYMDGKHIDYDTALLKNDAQINVVMVGFGHTNQQIFLSMVANNQFLTKNPNGEIVEKPVKYHIFDKRNSFPNRGGFSYQYDFLKNPALNKDDYLPLPSAVAAEEYHNLDIDPQVFCKDLQSALDFGEKSVNYVIVSLGLDYASVNLADRIVSWLDDLKVKNTRVFVRIHNEETFKNSEILLNSPFCAAFGANKDVVYDYAHIVKEKFARMAFMRNYMYDIEKDMKHNSVTEQEEKASRLKWYLKRSVIERESNVYACLSVRSKLHLIGLDCCKADVAGCKALTEEEYLSVYAENDKPDFVQNDEGQAVAVRYPLKYKQSRRKNLAVQEHCRWNAFMITKGFIPADKNRILTETDKDGEFTNGKNYAMRRHGNLTTFDGLVTFRKMIAERDGVPEEKCDVIKYDYQLLDGAYWLLNKNGYKIIKRKG